MLQSAIIERQMVRLVLGALPILTLTACQAQPSFPPDLTLDVMATKLAERPTSTPNWDKFLIGDTSDWEVKIVQAEEVLPEQDGFVRLKRMVFKIRLEMAVLHSVQLNALDNDANFREIVPGKTMEIECERVFCPGTGVAEGYSRSLLLSTEGTHFWNYRDEIGLPWDEIDLTGARAILGRNVTDVNMEGQETTTPLEMFSRTHLYLLFFVNYHDNQVFEQDELRRLILEFVE